MFGILPYIGLNYVFLSSNFAILSLGVHDCVKETHSLSTAEI